MDNIDNIPTFISHGNLKNQKINKLVAITNSCMGNVINTHVYKLNDKEDKVISKTLISYFHEDFVIFFNIKEEFEILLKISKYFKEKLNIKWNPTKNTKYFNLIGNSETDIPYSYTFVYPQNDKIKTMEFELDDKLNIISHSLKSEIEV